MTQRKQTFKSKRQVRKRVISINQFSVTNANTDLTLDTIEEKETIVRIVGSLSGFRNVAAGADDAAVFYIVVAPSGTNLWDIPAPSSTPVQEGSDAHSVLWHQAICLGAENDSFEVKIDTKAQRKLKEGDVIFLKHRSEMATGYICSTAMTLFYKKA